MSGNVGRAPPSDLDAEAAVLSAALLDRAALDKVQEILRPEQFYAEANRRIFEAAVALCKSHAPVDIVHVAGWLRDRDRLAQVGGSEYLAQIVDVVPSVANVDAYARRVREKWRVRQLIATCQRIAAEGYGDVGDLEEWFSRSEREVFEVCQQAGGAPAEVTLGDCAELAYGKIVEASLGGDETGARTGLQRLDQMLDGLRPGKLTVIAANPGMGKSVLVQTIARNVAKISNGAVGVQIFSPEMMAAELGERAIASEGQMNSMLFRGEISNDRWHQIHRAIEDLKELTVWVTDDADITVTALRARVRARQREFDRADAEGKPIRRLGVVILDYLQLIDAEQKKGQTREEALGNAAKALKRLAKKHRLHVIAISSLNKETDKRPNKRPQLNDVRESGAIGFHADNILLLYRQSYYEPECQEPDVVECNIAKQRGGPTGVVKLRFNMGESRFEDRVTWTNDTFPEAERAARPHALPHWSETNRQAET